MNRMAPEYFTFTHPRRSSDFSLNATAGDCSVYGVADMIGHPHGLRWRNYMRVMNRHLKTSILKAGPSDAASLSRLITDQLLWHSRTIHEFRVQHDREAFGFCLALAGMHGVDCRVVWLGDCRVYRVRRGARDRNTGMRAFDVACLTKDHNALGELVEKRGDVVLFRDEMIKLSKRLGAFMGMDSDDVVAARLAASVTPVVVQPGDCLLLMTDGVYTPHLRAQMDSANFHLSHDTYYLESWFAHLFAEASLRVPDGEFNYWPEMATILIEQTLRHVRRRKRYRDDMALTGVYLAGD